MDDEGKQLEGNGEPARDKDAALLDRCLRLCRTALELEEQEQNREEDIMGTALYNRFRKELGLLSIRPLHGDALFFRGLAARDHVPRRTRSDWRALLGQSAWIEHTREHAPERFPVIADFLLHAGDIDHACKAYELTRGTVADRPGLEKLRFYARLISLSREGSLSELFTFLKQEEPPLSPVLQPVLDIVSADEPGAADVAAFVENVQNQLPGDCVSPALDAVTELFRDPCHIKNLEPFPGIFGPQWQERCPVPPVHIIGMILNKCYKENRCGDALLILKRAENMGIPIPAEWKTAVHLAAAVEIALKGDFDDAHVFMENAAF